MKKLWIVIIALSIIGVLFAHTYMQTASVSTLLTIKSGATLDVDGTLDADDATLNLGGTNTFDGTNTFSTTATFTDTADFDGIITAGSGFWAGAPSFASNDMSRAFFYTEDFIGYGIDTTTAGLLHVIGWNVAGDASATLTQAAGTLGGFAVITPVTASNNEVYHQLGELGTETFVEFTASSGKKTWVEFRLNPNSIADAGNLLFGLAEEGSAAADFIADAGNDIADKDFVGFALWEGEPDSVEYIYQTSGSAFTVDDSTLITASLTTYGMYFDGDTTLSWYVNGTSTASVDIEDAGFPDAEELSPIVALKNGAADRTVTIDWIKIVSER